MDALQGYGSSSDSDQDHSRGAGDAPPLQVQQPAQGGPPRPSHAAPQPPESGTSGVKLPSAHELFGSPGQSIRPTSAGLRTIGGAVQKRQRPGGLRAGQPQPPKAQQSAAGVRPRRGGSGPLVPPQLRGRANVVTEDLDRLFTKKGKSPQQGAAAAAQQQ